LKLATFMALVLIFGTSCNDDDPVLPDYAGTWSTIDVLTTEEGSVQVKDIMTFTENSFSDLSQFQISSNTWTNMFSMGGTMVVTGDIMTVTITEIGVTSFSGVKGLPTGVITSYKKGTPEFDELITDNDQPKTFDSKFTISGNKMTLQTDHNGDGDYLDEYETSVYTKQ